MPGSSKKPRRLKSIRVDEVSLVDRPANEIEFLLVKRKEGGVEDDLAVEEIEKEADTGGDFPEACAEVCSAIDAFAEILEKREEAIEPKRRHRRMEKGRPPVTIGDLVKENEIGDLDRVHRAIEKVGRYGYPYGYPSPYGYPGRRPGEEPYPVLFDPARLRRSIEAALKVPGIPDAVKKALQEILDALGAEAKSDHVAKSEFEAFAIQTGQAIANLAEMIKIRRPKAPENEEESKKPKP